MRQLESVVEDFQVFFQRESGAGELLLIHIHEVSQFGGMIDEDQLAASLNQDSLL